MVWPRRHVSSLLKGLHQAPPARPPCARPAPPPGRRHVVTAEAGAGRVAVAHEAPAGGRGSGVGGARGGAGGSEDLPMSRTLRFCADLRRWSQEGGLMPARASSCASQLHPGANSCKLAPQCCRAAFRMLPHRHDCGVAAGPASLPRAQCPEAPHCEPWAQTALAARFLPLDPQEKVLCLLRVCSPRCSSSAS